MKLKSSIQIQLFGAFRDLSEDGKLVIQIQNPASVLDIKSQILASARKIRASSEFGSQFDLEALLKVSVLATEDRIWRDHDVLDFDSNGSAQELAILPPVCGG